MQCAAPLIAVGQPRREERNLWVFFNFGNWEERNEKACPFQIQSMMSGSSGNFLITSMLLSVSVRDNGNGKKFNTTTALFLWKVAPTLQGPAQDIYLPEAQRKNFSPARSMRNWQYPSKNALFSNSGSWNPESKNPCYLVQDQQEARVC